MSSIYDKSSLVLIPSGTKTSKVYSQVPTNGDGDFDFTRSTAATRVNADGNIEKETQNLLLQSNSFNTTWTQNGVSVTGSQSGYDGSSDAWLLESTGASGSLRQSISYSSVICYSFYAKAGTANYVRLRLDAATQVNAWFNLSSGSVGTLSDGISSSMESVGNGWWRVSVMANATSLTTIRIYPSPTDAGGNSSGDNIYIQDAQLNQGLIAQEVITTTTTALYGGITDNVPRLDYTDSSCPALLLEPQRTNLVPYSEYVNANFSGSFETNAAISPDGTMNASKFVFTPGASFPQFYLSLSGLTIGQQYYSSIYIKKTEASEDFGMISSGVAFTPTDEWQRVVSSFTATGTTQTILVNYVTSVPIGVVNEVYVWGAQAELGSYATSYIPTYGTSVTRNGEVCDGAGDVNTFNSEEGVLFFDGQFLQDGRIGISNTDNSYQVVIGSAGGIFYRITENNSDPITQFITSNPNENHKIALKYKSTETSIFVDGFKLSTNSTPYSLSGLDSLQFTAQGSIFYGETKQVLYFPTALSDSELATLTTI